MSDAPTPEQADAYLTELSKLDDSTVQTILQGEVEKVRQLALPEEPMLKHFAFAHLSDTLRPVSFMFCERACRIATTIPRSAERTVALRKLLEAKDAGVRASLP